MNNNITIAIPSIQRTGFNLNQDAEDAVIVETSTELTIQQTDVRPRHLPLIKSNCTEVTLDHLKNDCITPVFAKTNEVCISIPAFIEATHDAVKDFYHGEEVENPVIYTSHIVKGRAPGCEFIPVQKLKDSQRTMYYERAIFAIQIPTLQQDCCGNTMTLSVIGMKNYGRDNLSGKLTPMKFSIGVGFSCMACNNGCFSADSVKEFVATRTIDIYQTTLELLQGYNAVEHLQLMQRMSNFYLTEQNVANILGRMKLYNYKTVTEQKKLGIEYVQDSQCNCIARQYYTDENFHSDSQGISMWNFYNLITGANKMSYANDYLSRAAAATTICAGLCDALDHKPTNYSWYLQ